MVAAKEILSTENSIDAEAHGVFEAVQLIKRKILSRVVIESDNQLVISAINQGNFCRRYWGQLLRESHEVMVKMNCVSVRWIRRTRNHGLSYFSIILIVF